MHLRASKPITDDDDLDAGDHIAVECHYKSGLSVYQHHGIIVKGRNSWKVIHLYMDGQVYKEDLSTFAKGIPCVQYIYDPKEALKPEEVIKNAEQHYKKQDQTYHMYTNNDEHFAMACKTGQSGWSLQTHLWPLISQAAAYSVSPEKFEWKHEHIYYKYCSWSFISGILFWVAIAVAIIWMIWF